MSAACICLRCSPRILAHGQCQLRYRSYASLNKLGSPGDSKLLPPPGLKPHRKESFEPHNAPYQWKRQGPQEAKSRHSRKETDQVLESLFSSSQISRQPSRTRYSRQPIEPVGFSGPLVEGLEVTHEAESKSLAGTEVQDAAVTAPSPRHSKQSADEKNYVEVTTSAMFKQLLDLQRQLHDGSATLEAIWQSCATIMKSQTWKANILSKPFQSEALSSVLRDILCEIAKRRSIHVNGKNFSPVDVIGFYRRNGAIECYWQDVLWIQLGNIMNSRHDSYTKEKESTKMDNLEALLQEILRVWISFVEIQQYDYGGTSGMKLMRFDEVSAMHKQANQNPDRSHVLSSIATLQKPTSEAPRLLSKRFQHLLCKDPRSRRIPNLAAAAVLTLHYIEVFRAEHPSKGASLAHAQSFVDLLHLLVTNVEWDCIGLESYLTKAAVPPQLLGNLRREWARSAVGLVRTSPSARESQKMSRRRTPSQWTEKATADLFSDLNHYRDSSDAAEAVHLWHRTKPVLDLQSLKDEAIRSQVFARFLSTSFAVRQQDQALDVWNHMVKVGHKPGPAHWTAMMHGCSLSRDVSSMNSIWSNMLKAKVRPGIEIWTAYIHGMIRSGNWQQGLALLEQLGREWKSHKDSTLTKGLPPVHAALTGLIQVGRRGMLATVLDWARSQGLQPNAQTYNILLGPIARSGTTQEVQSHLETMRKDNCQPDIITYNIILNNIVHSAQSDFHALNQEDQYTTIASLLADMKVNKINPTPHTYTSILDGLLDSKLHESNVPAARKIMNHMHSAGIAPSSHIYVILLTHYFSFSPPDLPAIDSLLHTLLIDASTASKNLDHIFYDRLIANFAKIDEYERALKFLRMMVQGGKAPSWTSLVATVKSLERAGEWDLCAEVIEGVESGEIMRWAGDRLRSLGFEDFWEIVDELRRQGLISGSSGANHDLE